MQCPLVPGQESTRNILHWLLRHAVSLEYQDNGGSRWNQACWQMMVRSGQEGMQQLRLSRAALLPDLFFQARDSMVKCSCGIACGCLWHRKCALAAQR